MIGLLAWSVRVLAAPADFLMDVWDTENNLPSSTVTSIAQTPDGYLWVGTYNGLARFDGARFVSFDPVSTPELNQSRVQGLSVDANGTLWISTFRGGLTSYCAGVFRKEWPDQAVFDLHTSLVVSSSNLVEFVTQFGEVMWRDPLDTNANWNVVTPSAGSRPTYYCADAAGNLWFLTRDAHILRFADGGFHELTEDGGLAGTHIYSLVADTHGQVWAGAGNHITRWNGSRFEDLTPTNTTANLTPWLLFPTKSGAVWVLDGGHLRKMVGRAWVAEAPEWDGLLGWASGRAMGMHEDRDGGVWFNHYGNGLFHITPEGQFQRITTLNGLPGDRVGAWFQGRDGGIWAGVDRGGLVRLRDRQFHVIGPAEGLPVRAALSVCQDTNGGVWIGTGGGGLCRWRDGKITRYAIGPSAAPNFVFSIFPEPGGGAWLSAAEAESLYEFKDGQVRRSTWDVRGIKSILTDHQGRLWLGIKAGFAWAAGDDRQILNTNADGSLLPAIRALAETSDGNLWAGADDGTIYLCSPGKMQPFRAVDALADQAVYALHADASGTLWAGTFHGGLVRFQNGKFSRITTKQGLPADVISQILEDSHGRLWLGTHQGIFCVDKLSLNACADGRSSSLDYIAYGRHDGLPALECSDGYQPACWRGTDGRLWFTTVRGVVWVDPNALTAESAPPPVLVEEFNVDGEPVSLTDGDINVPPGHSQFNFRFTALNFDAGERARFRYRLEGFDSRWVDAETLRTAHYGHLPPGNYRFHVIACNNQGVWNYTGAVIHFTVAPYFYQSNSFMAFIGALVIAGVAFGVRRAATRKYRRRVARLEQQNAIERDRARIARDIHDDVGAGLTQITLLTELARREPEQMPANLQRISDSARKITKSMDEIVWAVDPQHDTLDGLLDYASAYAEDFLRVANVRFRTDLPVTLPVARVDAERRYNLFLAFKEVLNNIVKHAKATEVWLRLRVGPQEFTLIIEDNGRGLAASSGDTTVGADRLASGSGLGNLEKRLATVGGRCDIHSAAGQGTRVELTVALTHRPSSNGPVGQDADRG